MKEMASDFLKRSYPKSPSVLDPLSVHWTSFEIILWFCCLMPDCVLTLVCPAVFLDCVLVLSIQPSGIWILNPLKDNF